MKKRLLYLLLAFTFIAYNVKAQVTIGSDKAPEGYSTLELDSKEGGVRLNQLNASAKAAVETKLKNSENKSLTNGLTIFDMEENKVQYWDGDGWTQVLSVEANENVDGTDGQVLMSKGKDGYPQWTTLNLPKVQTGEFYLYNSTVKKDMTGADLPHIGTNMETYTEDLILNGASSQNWVEIKDLEMKITVPDIPKQPGDPADKVYTRLALEMQTGAQMLMGPKSTSFTVRDTGGTIRQITIKQDPWISFAIGVFIGNDQDGYKLKQVRSTRQEGSSGENAFSIFTVIGAVDNLPAGEQTIKVAVKRRMQAGFMESEPVDKVILTVGKPAPGAPNYNNFMAQSFLRADLYVIYD